MRRLYLPLLASFALLILGCGKETTETVTPNGANGANSLPKDPKQGKLKPKLAP